MTDGQQIEPECAPKLYSCEDSMHVSLIHRDMPLSIKRLWYVEIGHKAVSKLIIIHMAATYSRWCRIVPTNVQKQEKLPNRLAPDAERICCSARLLSMLARTTSWTNNDSFDYP